MTVGRVVHYVVGDIASTVHVLMKLYEGLLFLTRPSPRKASGDGSYMSRKLGLDAGDGER